MKLHAKMLLLALLTCPLVACNNQTSSSVSTSKPTTTPTTIVPTTPPSTSATSTVASIDFKKYDGEVTVGKDYEGWGINLEKVVGGTAVMEDFEASIESPALNATGSLRTTISVNYLTSAITKLGKTELTISAIDKDGKDVETTKFTAADFTLGSNKNIVYDFKNLDNKITKIKVSVSDIEGGAQIKVSNISIEAIQ